MKPEAIFKYLSYLHNQNNNSESGFTLIELLVVVIIIGVLAAVALPNMLGQVGKAREVECKNAIGTVNRGQQARHFEKGEWSGPLSNADLQGINSLGVKIPANKYYVFTVGGATSATASTILCEGVDAANNVDNGATYGTRDYSGMTEFVAVNGVYKTIVCQANTSATIPGVVPINTNGCPADHNIMW